MFDKHFETSDGIKIAYSVGKNTSAKNAILFNYGLACNVNHWKYQIPFFEEQGFRLILHDYRFHHQSEGTSHIDECTFKNITKDIGELLDHLGIEKIFVVGHSMGVNISLEMATVFPEKIIGLVLISGTLFPPQEVMFNSKIMDVALPYIKMFRKHFPNTYEQFWLTQSVNPLAKKIVHKGGFNTKQVSEEFVTIYMKKISELPEELFFHLMEEMRGHDIIRDMENIKTPSLVIGGERDYVIPSYLQRTIHQYLENSELYIVKDGSHVPQVDFPDAVNDRILHFFNDIYRGQEIFLRE